MYHHRNGMLFMNDKIFLEPAFAFFPRTRLYAIGERSALASVEKRNLVLVDMGEFDLSLDEVSSFLNFLESERRNGALFGLIDKTLKVEKYEKGMFRALVKGLTGSKTPQPESPINLASLIDDMEQAESKQKHMEKWMRK